MRCMCPDPRRIPALLGGRPGGPSPRAPVGPRPADGGFLYVEVLLALSLLAVSLLAIVPLFVLAAQGNAASGDLTFAATLAHDKAESLRASGYPALGTSSKQTYVNMRSIRYKISWQIWEDTPHPGMKQVRVRVEPQRSDRVGQARNAELTFYVTP